MMDTAKHKLLTFAVKEHSGLKIDLPEGSLIKAAFYGSVDGISGINVTEKALQIYEGQGKLRASNTLFGDPASKKQKKLIVEAWVPPEAATQYELRSTSLPSRASILDASKHKLLAFHVKEHSGLKIDLPEGSQIEAAFYGSVDGISGINVTKKAVQIYKSQGQLCASNKLFGDPASKKQKRLIVKALVPHDAATQYEMRSTSVPSRASLLASSNRGSAAPLRQIHSDFQGKSYDCKASTKSPKTAHDEPPQQRRRLQHEEKLDLSLDELIALDRSLHDLNVQEE